MLCLAANIVNYLAAPRQRITANAPSAVHDGENGFFTNDATHNGTHTDRFFITPPGGKLKPSTCPSLTGYLPCLTHRLPGMCPLRREFRAWPTRGLRLEERAQSIRWPRNYSTLLLAK